MTIEEAREHIGDGVVYENRYGPYEDGIITSVNDRFAFVRYGSDEASKATYPEDLALPAAAPVQPARCDRALDTASEICPSCFSQHTWLLED